MTKKRGTSLTDVPLPGGWIYNFKDYLCEEKVNKANNYSGQVGPNICELFSADIIPSISGSQSKKILL